VLYSKEEPVGSSLDTKASNGPFNVVSKAPGVVGKSEEKVDPVTYVAPSGPTTRSVAVSVSLPPRNVPYSRPFPAEGFLLSPWKRGVPEPGAPVNETPEPRTFPRMSRPS